MLRNRFTAKLIGLLLTTLFFSGLQSVNAVDVKAYVGPIIRFAQPGTYVFTLSMGSTNKSFTIKVSK